MKNVLEAPENVVITKAKPEKLLAQSLLGVDSFILRVRMKSPAGGGGGKAGNGSDSDDLRDTLLRWLPGGDKSEEEAPRLSGLTETLLKWLPGGKEKDDNDSGSQGSSSG